MNIAALLLCIHLKPSWQPHIFNTCKSDGASQTESSLCEQFFHVLQREFFTPTLRKRFQQSVEMLQQDLDAFVEAYNSQRTDLGTDEQDRPPLEIFLEATKS